MAHQPVLLLHISAGFDIKIAAARQCSYKQIRLVLLACNAVKVRYRAARPIDLHGISGFMCNTHSSLSYTSPATIFVTELRAHVGYFSISVGTLAVFLPEQRKCNAFL